MLPSQHHRTHNHVILLSAGIFLYHHRLLRPAEATVNNPSTPMDQVDDITQQDAVSAFQPSLSVVLAVLSLMFSLTFFLILYAKCRRGRSSYSNSSASSAAPNRRRLAVFNFSSATTNHHISGIDKKVIELLPFFRFGTLKGPKDGLECAVCLSKFEDVEILRLLPKCKHAFHIACVDRWLEDHSTCPLCRRRVTVEDAAAAAASFGCSGGNSLRVLVGGSGRSGGLAGSNRRSGRIVTEEDPNPNPNPNPSTDSSDPNLNLDPGPDSTFHLRELFVEREEDEEDEEEEGEANTRVLSSRSILNIGNSFRRIFFAGRDVDNGISEDKKPISGDRSSRTLHRHKHKHKILVSDVVFKNRWSNVSPFDLMFLQSEMLGAVSSERFSSTSAASKADQLPPVVDRGEVVRKIKGQMERRRWLEQRAAAEFANRSNSSACATSTTTSVPGEVPYDSGHCDDTPAVVSGRRSVSEITMFSRFKDFNWKRNGGRGNLEADGDGGWEEVEKRRKIWFPIAKRTVEMFSSREEYYTKMNHRRHPAFDQV